MSVLIQKGPAHHTDDQTLALRRGLEDLVEQGQHQVVVCRGGDWVYCSRDLLLLWSPLLRSVAKEGRQEQVLLPAFTKKVVSKALGLLEGGWGEQQVGMEEVQMLQVLGIKVPVEQVLGFNVQVKQELEEVEEVEVKQEVEEAELQEGEDDENMTVGDNMVKMEPNEKIRAGIEKIEKIKPKNRTKIQKLSLKVLQDHLRNMTDQEIKGSKLRQVDKDKFNPIKASNPIRKTLTLINCNHCAKKFLNEKSLNMHTKDNHQAETLFPNEAQENESMDDVNFSKSTGVEEEPDEQTYGNLATKDNNKDDGKTSKIEKLETTQANPVKTQIILLDCDLCTIKFLNEKSLSMHKQCEHKGA